MTVYTSAHQRQVTRQRVRIERRRQQMLDELSSGDPELRDHLSQQTYAELICLRHLPTPIPGVLRTDSLPSQDTGSINQDSVTEPREETP